MRKFNKDIVIMLCILSIFVGKLVRYTIMKESLVDTGIGHFFIVDIINHNTNFGIVTMENSNNAGAGGNTNFIFDKINFLGLETYELFEIYISIIFNLIVILLIFKNCKESITDKKATFLILSVIVLNIWDFCLAKEPIQMLYFLANFFIIKSKFSDRKKAILILLVYLLSALTFRIYYLLLSLFMIVFILIDRFYIREKTNFKFKNLLFVIFLIYFAYLIILFITSKYKVSIYNELIRVRLRTSNATTVINSIFNSDNIFIFCFDYIISIIRLLFPIELVRFGFKYFLYFVYQIVLSFYIIKNMINYNKISNYKKLSLYIYIAFLLGSATFEPDFGSWIRHEAVLFPIFIYLSDLYKGEDKINEIKAIE